MAEGNGFVARLDRAELDIQKLDAEKAEKTDLSRVERTLREIRDEVHELNQTMTKSREAVPWTRGQRITLAGVILGTFVGIGSLLATVIIATGGGT